MDNKAMLSIEPVAQRYSAADGSLPGRDKLVEHLVSQRDTQPVLITKESDVLLDGMGLVGGRYRMTAVALGQLCSVLAPGLSNTVQSLSGMRRREKDAANETYSVKKAIEFLNNMIRVRFGLLDNRYQFILDRRSRQIEGVVGPRYRFLSNLEMFQRVEACVSQARDPAFFCEAALAGRRLQLRYKNGERAFALETTRDKMEPFYGGWHFSNSELGDCCVKGSAILYRQWSGTAAIQPYDASTKLVHLQGDKFEGKFREVLVCIQNRVERLPEMESAFVRLRRSNLGLGGAPEKHDKRFTLLVAVLNKGGLGFRAATDAVTRAVVCGSYRPDAVSVEKGPVLPQGISPQAMSMIADRTVFDVYNAVGFIARKFAQPEQQEVIEQVAFKLLTNQVSLTNEEL